MCIAKSLLDEKGKKLCSSMHSKEEYDFRQNHKNVFVREGQNHKNKMHYDPFPEQRYSLFTHLVYRHVERIAFPLHIFTLNWHFHVNCQI